MTALIVNLADANGLTLPAMVQRAASLLAGAQTAAEVLEAREMASVAYDMAKRASRLAKAKDAHDELIIKIHRSQADALEIEARAKRRLADEYDAAQERGEVAKDGRPKTVPDENGLPATATDLGISRKDIHEARLIRDAENVDPGIVRRVLEKKLNLKDEPTRAALREAVIEAARQGLRPERAPDRRNPHYKPPTPAEAAWTHVYGTCRALAEWATEENLSLALRGRSERRDDQSANVAAVRTAAGILRRIAGGLNAD